jgi:WD40 repeat protein
MQYLPSLRYAVDSIRITRPVHPSLAFLVSTLLVLMILLPGSAASALNDNALTPVNNAPPDLVMQAGHTKSVDAIAISPDGLLLASGSADNSARLWEVATGHEIRTFSGHSLGIKALAFSPDSKLLVSGAIDGHVKLWNTVTGSALWDQPDCGSASAAAFSRDGRWIAVGNMEKTIKLLDATTGRQKGTLSGHNGLITALAFSPDARILASGSADHTIRFWEPETGREKRSLLDHTDRVTTVAFSPDGKWLASGSRDTKVKIWNANTGRVQRNFTDSTAEILAVIFSADGKLLIAETAAKAVAQWDVASGSKIVESKAQDYESLSSAVAGVISSNGQFTANSIGDKSVSIQDVATGRELRRLTSHSYSVYATAFSPDGRWFASGGSENTVKLWEIASGRELHTLETNSFVNAITFSLDGRWIVAGSLSGAITVWEADTGQELKRLVSHTGSVNGLAFSSDGRWLASAGGDQSVKLWDAATWTVSRNFVGHSDEVYAVGFSPDSKVLASASADKTAKLWDIATGQEVLMLTGHSGPVLAVSFSPDGQRLATGSTDYKVILWERATGREQRTLVGHTGEVKSVAFSNDGRLVFSGSKDTSIRGWDTETGRETLNLLGHSGAVHSLTLNPGGQWLASGSDDGSSRIWDAKTGQAIATLISLRQSSAGIADVRTDWVVITPDGLFDGSSAAWSQILWRFDKNTFNTRPVEVFFNDYFYPGLLAEILSGQHPKASHDIAQVDRRQPQISIAPAANDAVINGVVSNRNLPLRLVIEEAPPDGSHPAGSGVRDVRLFRNGTLVKAWHGDLFKGPDKKMTLEAVLTVVAGANELTAYAFNSDNIKSADAHLLVTGAEGVKHSSTAYILAIGVNKYANQGFNLKYAVSDADDFSNEMRAAQQNLRGRFERVEVLELQDQQATKENIMAALGRLAPGTGADLPVNASLDLTKLATAQPEDTVVLYFASHGLANQSSFYIIPHDLGYQGTRGRLNAAGLDTIMSHSISDRELEQSFERIAAGNILFIIDACNSGQVLESEEKRRGPMNSKGLAQLAYEKGMYILAASQSYQAAVEAAELGHGLLTYALIEEGLKQGKADSAPRDGKVLLQEWFDYATARVPELQQRQMDRARELVIVEEEVRQAGFSKSSVQRPRVFYRRDTPVPLIAVR